MFKKQNCWFPYVIGVGIFGLNLHLVTIVLIRERLVDCALNQSH